ncbi:Zinc finger matrin-type protein 2 [Nymphon striatum]|nr:Zinc finger matrin-type protein 2 [Nymphon striatum]
MFDMYFSDQRNLGMSMRVERSSLDQVKKRFEMNKKKLEEKAKEYDFEQRMVELREELLLTCHPSILSVVFLYFGDLPSFPTLNFSTIHLPAPHEERQKELRKEKRKERKRKAESSSHHSNDMDPEMAAMTHDVWPLDLILSSAQVSFTSFQGKEVECLVTTSNLQQNSGQSMIEVRILESLYILKNRPKLNENISAFPLLVARQGCIEGVRDKGRQRRTWGDDVKEWTRTTTIGEAKRIAENKEEWRISWSKTCLYNAQDSAIDQDSSLRSIKSMYINHFFVLSTGSVRNHKHSECTLEKIMKNMQNKSLS